MARGPQRRGAQCSSIGCIGLRPMALVVMCSKLVEVHAKKVN